LLIFTTISNFSQIKQQWLKNADTKGSIASLEQLKDATEVISYWPFAMEDVEKKDAYFDGIMADFVSTRIVTLNQICFWNF